MPITIACKHLASLNQPQPCARCFWLRCRCSRTPYAIFPGIFAAIDGYSKGLVDAAHAGGALPGWLADEYGFVEPLTVPHFTRFCRHDPATGITLRGAPDAMFRRRDQSMAIVDWKCAKYTAGQERLSGLYEAQLNGYAWIAEPLGYSPISHLSLIYTEPVTEFLTDELSSLIDATGFIMPFKATFVPVINRADELIPDLLRRARRILDGPLPDASTHCKDCAALKQLLSYFTGGVACLR